MEGIIMGNKKIIRADFIQSVAYKSKRDVVREIIRQIQLSGIKLTEKDSRSLFASLIESNCTKILVKIIYKAIESNLKDYLYDANKKCNSKIAVTILKGVTVTATKIPKRTKLNNFTGERQVFKSYVKPKAEFSRGFIKSISSESKIN